MSLTIAGPSSDTAIWRARYAIYLVGDTAEVSF